MKDKPTLKQQLNSKMQALQWNASLGVHEYKERRMTYGKYVNRKISELPIGYLKWGILNLEDTRTAEYFSREIQTRKEFKNL